MRNHDLQRRHSRAAFTLVELLVVVSVIMILGALLFPIRTAIDKAKTVKMAYSELRQVETAIDAYKARYGHYPPDNRANSHLNPLYFELMGTVRPGPGQPSFVTLDGNGAVTPAQALQAFGVSGFVNSASSRTGGDEERAPEAFIKDLRAEQAEPVNEQTPQLKVLVCSVGWPSFMDYQPVPSNPGVSPWQYNSSNPTNNPESVDLWVDLMIDGRTNRINNWSKAPQVVR